jgi:hypothetical protein
LGGRLRVTTRLIDGSSGAEFARASFEQPAGNFLGTQDTLTQKVAGLIQNNKHVLQLLLGNIGMPGGGNTYSARVLIYDGLPAVEAQQRLEVALAVPVPEGLVERILLRQTTDRRVASRSGGPRWSTSRGPSCSRGPRSW